jgi:hypothetical protein
MSTAVNYNDGGVGQRIVVSESPAQIAAKIAEVSGSFVVLTGADDGKKLGIKAASVESFWEQ